MTFGLVKPLDGEGSGQAVHLYTRLHLARGKYADSQTGDDQLPCGFIPARAAADEPLQLALPAENGSWNCPIHAIRLIPIMRLLGR
jgi:hypothetical protein